MSFIFVPYKAGLKLLCYYKHGTGPLSNIDPHICSHIHYSYITLDEISNEIRFKLNDQGLDDMKQIQALKTQNENLFNFNLFSTWYFKE